MTQNIASSHLKPTPLARPDILCQAVFIIFLANISQGFPPKNRYVQTKIIITNITNRVNTRQL